MECHTAPEMAIKLADLINNPVCSVVVGGLRFTAARIPDHVEADKVSQTAKCKSNAVFAIAATHIALKACASFIEFRLSSSKQFHFLPERDLFTPTILAIAQTRLQLHPR